MDIYLGTLSTYWYNQLLVAFGAVSTPATTTTNGAWKQKTPT